MTEQIKRPVFTGTEVVFAWLCIVLGYLFPRTLPLYTKPIAGFLYILALFVTAFVILKLHKVRLRAHILLTAASALVVAATFFVTDSIFLSILAYQYALLTYCYCLYAATGNRVQEGFSDYVFLDYLKAVFILPFCSIVSIFFAMIQGKGKSGAFFLVKILIGIVLAAIPTMLVLLLLSYDGEFTSLLTGLFTMDWRTLLSRLEGLLFAIPFGMYHFGLYTSGKERKLHKQIDAQNTDNILEKIRILPQLSVLSAGIPLVFIYVLFFVSQWQYFISGFTGILPEGFSYAQYARQGFFQLCAVSVINLSLILLFRLFVNRGKRRNAPVMKATSVVFCLCTLILISTAVAKLVMYIDCYGLTPMRIYAMWLMAVIALVFLIIAVGQFIPKAKLTAATFSVCVAMFTVLALCNVNQISAEYNVERYLNGSLQTVDVTWLSRMGDSAVPSLVRLAQTKEDAKPPLTDEEYEQIDQRLEYYAWKYQNDGAGFFAYTLPYYNARAALKSYGLMDVQQSDK